MAGMTLREAAAAAYATEQEVDSNTKSGYVTDLRDDAQEALEKLMWPITVKSASMTIKDQNPRTDTVILSDGDVNIAVVRSAAEDGDADSKPVFTFSLVTGSKADGWTMVDHFVDLAGLGELLDSQGGTPG